MAQIIATACRKGGSCKSTTAANVAALLALAGKRVLLVDLDSQGDGTDSVGADSDDGEGLLAALVGQGDLASVPVASGVAGLQVIAGGAALAGIDDAIKSMKDKAKAAAPGLLLRRQLKTVETAFDFIVIDTAPNLSTLTISALLAADVVLVPMEPSVHSLDGALDTVETFRDAQELNPRLKTCRVVLSRVDGRLALTRGVVDKLMQECGDLVAQTRIRQAVAVAEAVVSRAPVVVTSPGSPAAQDFRDLVAEVFGVQQEGAAQHG